jgi:hypothetical protein
MAERKEEIGKLTRNLRKELKDKWKQLTGVIQGESSPAIAKAVNREHSTVRTNCRDMGFARFEVL